MNDENEFMEYCYLTRRDVADWLSECRIGFDEKENHSNKTQLDKIQELRSKQNYGRLFPYNQNNRGGTDNDISNSKRT